MTDFIHDDNRAVAVPFWTLREAPSIAAAVVYQQLRFWSSTGPDGRPRSMAKDWHYERGGEVWLAIPDNVWGEIGLSPDQLYRVRKQLLEHQWIEARRMKVDGRPVACVRVVPRDIAESDSAEARTSVSATSRTSTTAEARNPPLIERGEIRERGAAGGAGRRIAADWWPDEKLAAWTAATTPTISLAHEVPKFVDYWLSQPGAKGRKADWPATWRNWCRRAAGDASGQQVAAVRERGVVACEDCGDTGWRDVVGGAAVPCESCSTSRRVS